MNQNWNSSKYTSDFSFVHNYGNDVLELIDTAGVKDVLDLGCGNGALTNVLAGKGFSVIGMDASEEMLEIARSNYPGIPFIRADAVDFALESPVDVVFSNAVFHWIDRADQPRMLECVYRALRKGGQFVFEMGGLGNNALIHGALADSFRQCGYSYQIPFYFPSVGEYARMLEYAGFQVRFAVLFDRPTKLKGENGLTDWINMFVKNPFLEIDGEDRDIIIQTAVKSLSSDLYQENAWYADYVRLRMKAVKI